MEKYIQSLKAHIAANPPSFGEGGAQSILDMLFVHYVEYNPLENDTVRQALSHLDDSLEPLPLAQCDQVNYLVSDICWELQRRAFSAGIQVGIRLAQELSPH